MTRTAYKMTGRSRIWDLTIGRRPAIGQGVPSRLERCRTSPRSDAGKQLLLDNFGLLVMPLVLTLALPLAWVMNRFVGAISHDFYAPS